MRRFRLPLSRSLARGRRARVRFAHRCRRLAFPFLLLPSALAGCGLFFDSGASSRAAGETAALSPPGIEWTRRKAPGGKQRDIAWSGSQFVAVGDIPILTSPDGIKWTGREAPLIEHIIWAGSQFVGVTGGTGARSGIYFSKDGSTWTKRRPTLDMKYPGLTGIAWNGSQLVAVGAIWDGNHRPRGRYTAVILTSTDNATWTPRHVPTDGGLWGITWGGFLFVAVGGYKRSGLEPLILTSPDGVTWTEQNVPVLMDSHDPMGLGESLQDVTWSGNRFVAVGSGIVSSPDGITWTRATVPAHAGGLEAVAGGASQFVAVGMRPDGTLIFSSPDGNMWTQRKSPSYGGLWGITWGGSRFVAVGSVRGWIVSSSHAIVLTSP